MKNISTSVIGNIRNLVDGGVLLCLVCVVAWSASFAQIKTEERKLHLDSFDMAWKTVKETHYDSTIGGLDWQAIYDTLRPRMERVSTNREARSILQMMIAPLDQSHFFIVPGEYYRGRRTDSLLSIVGVPGFDFRLIEGKVVVTSVRKESPAFARGVRPGWEVVRIRNEEVKASIEKIAQVYITKTRYEFEVIQDLISSLRGTVGDSGHVEFRDEVDQLRDVVVVLSPAPGYPIPSFGNIPPTRVEFEARKFHSAIGYIRFNSFAGPAYLMSQFNSAVDSFITAPGIIIDLRGNNGGLGGIIGVGMAGWFVKERGKSLGTVVGRDRRTPYIITPRLRTFDGPLAVLVDGLSISAAELFSGGMKDIGRARLFGTRTAGFSALADITKLPNGDMFAHAIAQHLRSDGVDVEGNGIVPDVEVRPTRQALLQGRDEVLEAACAWIEIQSKKPRKEEHTRDNSRKE